MTQVLVTGNPRKEKATAGWVAFIAATALIFDGYDLTIYGTVLPTLLNDPSQLGELDPATAGALGSYAMLGVLGGAIIAGAIGDYIGRRKLLMGSITWFSVGMLITAMSTSIFAFGLLRFLTGLGLGSLLAVAGATIAEFAPAGKQQLYSAIVYCGIPLGGIVAAGAGIAFLDSIGWRGLFFIGAAPILLVPLAMFKLPESPRWLLSRGRRSEAIMTAEKNGLPLVDELEVMDDTKAAQRTGYAALLTQKFLLPTIFLGLMSYSGMLVTYGLQTWLPRIMESYGYGSSYSLTFLLVLNLGAAVGILTLSRLSDKVGPRPILVGSLILAAVSLTLLTMDFPFPLRLLLVACAGMGSIGTIALGYGFVASYYTTNARGAGVAWFSGFGRLGAVTGPLIAGVLTAAGFGATANFFVFGAVALFGAIILLLVRPQRDLAKIHESLKAAKEGEEIEAGVNPH